MNVTSGSSPWLRLGCVALVHESELARNNPSPCRSPPDGVRRRPATLSHLIEDVACEDGRSPLPCRTARVKAKLAFAHDRQSRTVS